MPKTPQRSSRPTRESFHILVDADGQSVFANATAHIGGEWPFKKPQLTCAMRVAEDVVSFSVLRPTKNTVAQLTAKPVAFPRSPLLRLERRGGAVDLSGDSNMIVEITTRLPFEPEANTEPAAADGNDLAGIFSEAGTDKQAPEASATPKKRQPRPTVTDTYECRLTVDESGVARIEQVGDDTEFELPRFAMNVSVYIPGVRGRTLSIGWIGFFGKSGKPESVARVGAMVINALSQLADFRILSGIEHVQLGAAPAQATKPQRRVADVEFGTRVHFFNDQLEPVAVGNVGVRIDMDNANSASGRLMMHYTPDEQAADVFDTYRNVVDSAISAVFNHELGEVAIRELVYDIVLGEADERSVETLRDIGSKLPALQVTPTAFQQHS